MLKANKCIYFHISFIGCVCSICIFYILYFIFEDCVCELNGVARDCIHVTEFSESDDALSSVSDENADA